jgi:diguanylate cyclase (GGDEF)-like protein/PAS domain S-box-containing protein
MTTPTEAFGPDTPLYNSKIILGYVRFAERRCAGVNINEVLAYAGIETYQLGDEDHWFTQAQMDRFQEKLAELTGNGDIAREAARYVASSSSMGIIKYYALSFVNPLKLCQMIGKTAGFFTRSVIWEAKETGPRTIEITVTPRPGTRGKPFMCQGRIGYLEGISQLFGHRFPLVEQTECVFHGGRCCRYVVTWSRPRSEWWKKARNYLALSFPVLSAGLFFVSTQRVSAAAMLVLLAVVLALSARAWRMEKDELYSALGNLRSATETLIEKTEADRNHARLVQDIRQALTGQKSIEGILQEAAQVLQQHFDYDRGMILLADKEKHSLNVRATFGWPEELAPALHDRDLTVGPESRSFLVRCFREQRPFLINNAAETGDLPASCAEFTRKTWTKAFICCPIVCADDALGVLAVSNVKTKRPLLQQDVNRLTQLGRQIGVSIRNVTAKQAEKAVRESEARFRAVVEKSGEIIVLTDARGNFVYVSPPATAVFGYSPGEYYGQHWGTLVHPDDCGPLEELSVWLRANPGETKDTVVRVRHKDGAWRWVEITSRNLLAEPGVRALVSNVRDITSRKIAEETLRESENKFKYLVEESPVGVYLIQEGVFRYVNSKCAEIHGCDASEMVDRMRVTEMIFPGDEPSIEESWWTLGQNQCRTQQFRIVTKTGEIRHVECYATGTMYRGRRAVIGTLLDITACRADEEALRWKTTFLEALVKSNHDGILVIDSQGRKIMQNQRTEDIWKIPEDALTEKQRMAHFKSMVMDPESLREKIVYLNDHPDETMRSEIELKIGTIVDTSSSPVIGEDGRRYGRIWTFRDITELKHYWDMLVDLSTTDGLTELANRRRFDEFLEREWRRSMREESALSLILMDIDFFKEYNDHYGHLAGDDCLRHVAGVLGRLVQRPGDLVARYGGEEFACILPGTNQEGATELADKIMRSINGLNLPHRTSRVASHLTLSFGVATTVPERGQSPSELIRLADHLLYSAKKEGRNRVKCWRQKTRRRKAL